jgi:integrase
VVRELLRGAGLWRQWRGPHAFRRTFATEFLRARPGELRRLQVLMRHRQLATTVLYDFPEPSDYAGAVAGLSLGAA